jgi:hypothetical protein
MSFRKIPVLFFLFVVYFGSFNFSFSVGITNPRLLGSDCSTEKPTDFSDASEIKIVYAGRDDLPYGGRRTSAIQSIVWHDPGNNNCNIGPVLAYGHTRGNHEGCMGIQCGYTFYIGANGEIVQGAPMNIKTNHYRQNNVSTIGLTLMCAGARTNLPESQVRNSILLSEALRVAYGFSMMIPHNKGPREGVFITHLASASRINQSGKFLIEYTFNGNQKLYCKISGQLQACSSNCDNSNLPGISIPRSYGPDLNFSSPYVSQNGSFLGDSSDWGYPLMTTQAYNPQKVGLPEAAYPSNTNSNSPVNTKNPFSSNIPTDNSQTNQDRKVVPSSVRIFGFYLYYIPYHLGQLLT